MAHSSSVSAYAGTQLKQIQARIHKAAVKASRSDAEITLIGASKRQSSELIRAFASHGLSAVGENYLQEAIEKRSELSDTSLSWHFIGQIQSNKTKPIAHHFNWVHGVDRLKIAQRLAKQNPNHTPINILLQLNPDAEQSKGGVTVQDAPALCDEIATIEGLVLRGFMMIPKPRENDIEQRAVFASAKELLELTNQRYGLAMDSLSMGMSGDLEAAIAEGSTMVRIGTDLFGARL